MRILGGIMNIGKAVRLGLFILSWYQKASKDGKISIEEIIEGAIQGLQYAGVDLQVDIPEEYME